MGGGRTVKEVKGSVQKGGGACVNEQSSLDNKDDDSSGPTISLFSSSVEGYFRAVDIISELCGEAENIVFEGGEMEQFVESVTFLSDWRHIKRNPKLVYFDFESQPGKGSSNGITLPQFSSASVPKTENISCESNFTESRNDFVLSVGGTVWALDWCPRGDLASDCDFKSEFIAISAHPPDSLYHKLGTPLSGRGLVQIWCILNRKSIRVDIPSLSEKPNQNTQRKYASKMDESQPKRPRGRPRKIPKAMNEDDLVSESQLGPSRAFEFRENPSDARVDGSFKIDGSNSDIAHNKGLNLGDPDSESQFVAPLAVGFPDTSLNASPAGEDNLDIPSTEKIKSKKRKGRKVVHASNVKPTYPVQKVSQEHKARVDDDTAPLLLTDKEEIDHLPIVVNSIVDSSGKDGLFKTVAQDESAITLAGDPIPEDILLPRVALCIAHDGEVAWDVKWRPRNHSDSDCKYRMGYLAVILGNGSIEVWDVPTPRAMKLIYPSGQEEHNDPRFVKMRPVFRCSFLRHGDRQSIPLTVEWSTSPPHDFLLTGCHDGVVALFNFSASQTPKDTRPMLCFSADTVPIRALAWAPSVGDAGSKNVIVTAGHEGMKFWDLRDPFRPLWFPKPHEAYIYGLDWAADPRCVITTYDDGTVRIFSQRKAAYDAPVTGKPYSGTKSQGEHFYNCSSFAIWSAQVSRLTGRVAYCGADGNVYHFQLTTKEVDNNDSRTRAPHFLCGALAEHGSGVIIKSPRADSSWAAKRCKSKGGSTAKSCRPIVYGSIEAGPESLKDNEPQSQVLALCYGNDPGDEDVDQTLNTLKKTRRTKTTNSKKEREKDQVSAASREDECSNNETTSGIADGGAGNANGGTDESTENKRSNVGMVEKPNMYFPPKVVAMHKVRWNMNKASERWLCYGGAAGIVRCQEITNPVIDKKRNRR